MVITSHQPFILPIEPFRTEILSAVRDHQTVLIQAEPGAGKTTRVPVFLLEDSSWLPKSALSKSAQSEIWILEPRRLAAKCAAEQIAKFLGEKVGQRIGYQFRSECQVSKHTRVLFLTEGLFMRRLLSCPLIDRVGLIIMDEFHERHLQTDLSYAWIRSIQEKLRPDLKLVIMSATLDKGDQKKFELKSDKTNNKIGENSVKWLTIPGKVYVLELQYPTPKLQDRSIEERIVSVIKEAVLQNPDLNSRNDLLVFLPGKSEIYRVERLLLAIPRLEERFEILHLHGELSREDQTHALSGQGAKRKIILSTNIAESSLTVPGVTIVIDSGLEKVAEESDSGLLQLRVKTVSQSSAIQRANRAGREGPGLCYRLYSREEFLRKSSSDLPEIARIGLAQWILNLCVLMDKTKKLRPGFTIEAIGELTWFEVPKTEALEKGVRLLQGIGALFNQSQKPTPQGEQIAQMGLDPRIGKLILESNRRGLADWGAGLGALLSEGQFPEPTQDYVQYAFQLFKGDMGGSESLQLSFQASFQASFQVKKLALHILSTIEEQAEAEPVESTIKKSVSIANDRVGAEISIRELLFQIFPDRVGRLKNDRVESSSGITYLIPDYLKLVLPEWFLVLSSHGDNRGVHLKAWCALDGSLLLDETHAFFKEESLLTWNNKFERVESKKRVSFGELLLWEEAVKGEGNGECDLQIFKLKIFEMIETQYFGISDQDRRDRNYSAYRVWENWSKIGIETELKNLIIRLSLMGTVLELREAFLSYVSLTGVQGLEEIKNNSFLGYLMDQLSQEQKKWLLEQVPESIRLTPKRMAKINYEENQPPWIESRLQDFFGCKEVPKLAYGKVAVTLKLLAPNYRPVQVTQDLASFWKNTYPKVRQELSRRYPKHAWPEDPTCSLVPRKS